jgi:hypothetical protein
VLTTWVVVAFLLTVVDHCDDGRTNLFPRRGDPLLSAGVIVVDVNQVDPLLS